MKLEYKICIVLAVMCLLNLQIFILIPEPSWDHKIPILNATSADLRKYKYNDLSKYIFSKRHIYLNIPIERYDSIKAQHQDECVEFPDIYRLNFNNEYWQKMDTVDGSTFYAYGAYFDSRNTIPKKRVIRILTMIDGYTPETEVFCHIWLKNVTAGIVAPVFEYTNLFYFTSGGFRSFLISCQIPKEHTADPEMVSLMEEPCTTPQVNLYVHYNFLPSERRQNFAVCVKGLAFLEDQSLKLIEWLELLFAMGVDKVLFHKFEVHPNTEKVLLHYEQQGMIEVVPISHPAFDSNIPKVREQLHIHDVGRQFINELIHYNDCFYRNMYKYNYISLLDIDEIIVPAKFDSWEKMVIEITANQNETNYSSYCFANYMYYHNFQNKSMSKVVPSFLNMIKNTIRGEKPSPPGWYAKCIHNTAEIISLHNHYASTCVSGNCSSYNAPYQVGGLHHHKMCAGGEECDLNKIHLVEDKTKWKYKDVVASKVFEVAGVLELI